jgi:titin
MYYYYVIAVNAIGNSSASGEVSSTPITAPSVPINLIITQGIDCLYLHWTTPASNGGSAIIGYELYRSNTAGTETAYKAIGTLFYNDTGLVLGDNYYYKVVAINGIGTSPFSNEVNDTVINFTSVPLNLQAYPIVNGVNLNWTLPTSNGFSPITGYEIFRGTTSGSETYFATIGNITSYSDTPVGIGQRYFYTVAAINALGVSPASNENNSMAFTAPSPPLNLTVTAGINSTLLNWAIPTFNGQSAITNYTIYRGDSAGTEILMVTIGNNTFYNDSIVAAGNYYYYVIAINSIGQSTLSNEQNCTPFTAPTEPLNLKATPSTTCIILSWSAPALSGNSPILGYYIYRGNTTGTEKLLATTVNVLNYNDSAVVSGQQYYYRIAAFNEIGTSALSSEIQNATVSAPSSPSGLLTYGLIGGGAVVVIVVGVVLGRRKGHKVVSDKKTEQEFF